MRGELQRLFCHIDDGLVDEFNGGWVAFEDWLHRFHRLNQCVEVNHIERGHPGCRYKVNLRFDRRCKRSL